MIEFLSDYPSAFSLVKCILALLCIVLGIECVSALRTNSAYYLIKVLGTIGLLISIAVPVGLNALSDEIYNYKQSKTCIYINNKIVDFGAKE